MQKALLSFHQPLDSRVHGTRQHMEKCCYNIKISPSQLEANQQNLQKVLRLVTHLSMIPCSHKLRIFLKTCTSKGLKAYINVHSRRRGHKCQKLALASLRKQLVRKLLGSTLDYGKTGELGLGNT